MAISKSTVHEHLIVACRLCPKNVHVAIQVGGVARWRAMEAWQPPAALIARSGMRRASFRTMGPKASSRDCSSATSVSSPTALRWAKTCALGRDQILRTARPVGHWPSLHTPERDQLQLSSSGGTTHKSCGLENQDDALLHQLTGRDRLFCYRLDNRLHSPAHQPNFETASSCNGTIFAPASVGGYPGVRGSSNRGLRIRRQRSALL